MDYYQDHLAWQQRVNQEFGAYQTKLPACETYEQMGKTYHYPGMNQL